MELNIEKEKKKIVFFYTKNEVVSGAFLMFLELAKYLAKDKIYEVYYIHYIHPELISQYKECKVNFKDYRLFDDYEMLNDATFIVPVNYLILLLQKISKLKESKILLIAWHPDIFSYFFNQFISYNYLKKEILQLFACRHALAFMDEANRFEANETSDIVFDPMYVPVPYMNTEASVAVVKMRDEKRINVGWLGRLDTDKIYVVINLAENLYASEFLINLHIIGDGNARARINISAYSPQIIFTFTSYLVGDVLEKYLIDNIDLLVAPGQSALLGASLRIPVIIPCVENRAFFANQYVNLFDCNNYSLGWTVKALQKLCYESHDINYFLNEVLDPIKKTNLAERNYRYLNKNHTIQNSLACLKDALCQTELTTFDLLQTNSIKRQMRQYALYNKVFQKDYLAYILLPPRINRFLNLSFSKKISKVAKFTLRKVGNVCIKPFRFISVLEGKIILRLQYLQTHFKYKSKITYIKNLYETNHKLNVAFLVIFDSVFPTLPVFEKMLKLEDYEPYIIVVPDISRGREYMIKNMIKSYTSLNNMYPGRVKYGYELQWDKYMELGERYSIVFFSNPYKNMVHHYHYVNYFLDKNVLTIYADYGFPAVKYARRVFQTELYNYVWSVFTDSKETFHSLQLFQPLHGLNAHISGYIKMDHLAGAKLQQRTRKRILICPHHTVMGWKALDISNFQKYQELFQQLPKDYPEVDFVFRPHPLLFVNLINKHIWSKEQVESYLKQLEENPNMRYDDSGDYFELFANSDGMIHDCSSYIGEYLFTGKPCCYMLKDEEQVPRIYSKIGQMCLGNYYKAFSECDIRYFIETVVVNEEDPLLKQRNMFADTVLKPFYPNSADVVIRYLENKLKG